LTADIIELAKTFLAATAIGGSPLFDIVYEETACSGSFSGPHKDFNPSTGGLGRSDGGGPRHGVTVIVPIMLSG
jgi:hypothetical protein